jgi:hypothetical protein
VGRRDERHARADHAKASCPRSVVEAALRKKDSAHARARRHLAKAFTLRGTNRADDGIADTHLSETLRLKRMTHTVRG